MYERVYFCNKQLRLRFMYLQVKHCQEEDFKLQYFMPC